MTVVGDRLLSKPVKVPVLLHVNLVGGRTFRPAKVNGIVDRDDFLAGL